ncbi:MAG: aldehyde dehydrogenase family protein [Alphaproteobacteria bacterium]|nr:aldehyde dehydrogenase family protein [Alphaproteobacteria bacterium]MDE2110497.1 aldehyde dehydrogenase family protein [Alphaproteobacteria bacterium]MDE2493247.1 aldehyde dehydrogenase family protein [Alphaproteobacteria bacterium]
MSETRSLRHLIGGDWIGTGVGIESLNPSNTADVVARAPDDDGTAMRAAIAAAAEAFPAWSQASPELRSDVLDRAGAAILARREELGHLLSREEGKTVPEGIGEVARAGRLFKFFAGEALRRTGDNVDSTRVGVEVTTYREPLGVFGLIAPWNFPIAIPAWKSAPALAFGNTVVLKPASLTPTIAAVMAEILHEAGAPKGVFNLVFGGAAAGNALVSDPRVAGISFTGSQGVGAGIAKLAVERQARLQMEMGGKNPLVVLDDADIDRAVQCALDGAFFASGQRCTASSRIIVTDGIFDRFVESLAEKVAALRVGDALDPDTKIGPVASEAQLKTVLDYIDIAAKEGARCIAGGERLKLSKPGYYVSPTLLVDTKPEMRVNCEEIFGPVASVVRVKNYDEALAVANMGEFGLSAGIVTTSLKRAVHFRRNVRAGMVMVNLPTAGVDYHVPFGGTRKSSYGPREQGAAAVEFYTQLKIAYTLA